MAFLNLSTYGDVPVDLDAGSAELTPELIGRRRRAFGGVMHSTVRNKVRRWSVRLKRVPRVTGDIIRLGLDSASPIGCSGDLIDPNGGVARCYVEDIRVQHPKHADGEYQLIEFTLVEEDEAAGLLLFSFDGDAPGAYTHTRTGTARYVDSDGVLQSAADGVARVGAFAEYLDLDGDGIFETPSYLGEPAATNDLLDSADVDAAGSANWTAGVAWTQANATSLFSGQTAQRYSNDGVTSSHSVFQNTPVLISTIVAASLIIENVDADDSQFGIFDVDVADWVVRGGYDWVSDVVSVVSSGVGTSPVARRTILAESGPNGGRVVRIQIAGIANNPGNAGRVYVYPVDTSINGRVAILHHAQYETGPVASSPIVTTTAAVSRGADLLSGDYQHARDIDITAYVRMIERGTALLGAFTGGSVRVFQIGSGNESLVVVANAVSPEYQALHTVGGLNRFTASSLSVVALGQEVELRVVLSESSFLLGQSLDGGAETTAAGTAGLGTNPWGVARLHIGNSESGDTGLNPIISLKVVRGIWTMDQMRSIARARPHALAA